MRRPLFMNVWVAPATPFILVEILEMKTSNQCENRAKRFATGVFCAAALATAFALCCASRASAQSAKHMNAVLTDKDAYLVLPAELIAGPIVELTTLSPQGRNVAVLRKGMRFAAENVPTAANPNPPGPREEQELVFWNAGTRKPVALWQSAQPNTQVTLSGWMPTTESLFAIIDRTIQPDAQHAGEAPVHEWRVLLLGLGVERAVVVPTPSIAEGEMQIDVSPLKPLAVLKILSYQPEQPVIFILIHPNARVGARIDRPVGSTGALMWDAAGNPVLAARQKAPAAARAFYSVDLRTGQTQLLPKVPQWYEPRRSVPPVLPFQVVNRRQDLLQADSLEHIRPVWLESLSKSENQRALLTADGEKVSLLPEANGAVFNALSALWFTPIVKMNKAEYLAARAAALKATAMSNARQLGLATLMFAQDNDEVMPGPDGIEANIGPYTGSSSLFDGFTYTYPGGSLADIVSPSETVLGHVAGPGGSAVIYADGHVKWEKN